MDLTPVDSLACALCNGPSTAHDVTLVLQLGVNVYTAENSHL